ncbi:UNVERIFIED_CONTAM: hypothetical protein Sindi_0093300 [Sesamum indicum]
MLTRFPAVLPAVNVDGGSEVAIGSGDVADDDGHSADISITRADVSNGSDDDSRADVSIDAAADVISDAAADVISDAAADVIKDCNMANEKSFVAPVQTGLYVGNIPLNAYPEPIIDDKIAHAFNHSTRKTLKFIAPTQQNGKVIVRPTLDTIRNGSKRWKSTAVGYFLGKRPYFHHLKEYAVSVWPGLREFKSVADMEDIIEGGPWLFQGQPIVLQKWEPGMVLRKLKHTQVPVWIKLRHLPVELWTEEGLSIVASGVGKPLYPDAITRACTRLDFARVCVMLDVNSKMPKHIIIMTPDEEGGEVPCKIDVQYEWLPPRCTNCMTLGHSVKECTVNKPKSIKPPVNGSKRWKSTAVGYFLGKRPYYHHLKEFAHSVWPALREVTATTNGFFFFQFKTVFDMEEIIEGGPWLFQGQPIVLQKWEPGMAMRKLKHTQVPVWIKLRHLPMEFWTTEGLSTVASGVGKPLYPDAITRACTRLDFARVCVMIDATQKLHKHIIVMAPDEEGGEIPCKVDVEYEWLPPKCTACMSLGHSNKDCALNKTRKPTKPTVNVYVLKVNVAQPQLPTKGRKTMKPVVEDIPKADAGDRHVDQNHSKQEERGKAIVIYNAFDALHLIDDAGILETRVRLNNVMHIQSFLLPHWKWFVDYSSVGNRIWIAWDENIVDVHILDSADQFIHCRVTNMADNESVIITVVYGASEVIDRRNLWTALETLSQQCSDIPWMVGGDFNAVRDLNEVCGISGDIRMATEEFNAGILEAELIPLPMQGEWFTWHNCSTSMRSLWKRLDRILINDRWLARFPSAYYHSLTPRTSDHSPLVLHGDIQQHNGGMFRFDNYLAHSPEFIHNVQNIWHHEIVGIPMYAVTRKLKALKPVFRLQRRNKGDLTMNVQLAKGFLDEAQQLVSSDRQNELYLLLEHCCRVVYAKAAKLEQIMLQQRAKMQWMKDGDQCSRVFFRKIAQRRVMRRILQINDENGFTHTDLGEIAHEFVSYYQNLLGGTRRRLSVDIRYLRPWARHCITDEEANQLLLPLSADDVKQAVFDIADDKAPGPDGYSSRFFKAAWPVVGEEVTRAVLDFFSTGKLLKQINSTILALIPKVHTPMSVNDFRPISCCNVLYKIIAKLLVQKISVLLDKIVSPCQTAFIPGRSIGDNIMLAQELFSRYNQMRLPPRCALKVDIRKAYDTVEWDFLLAVLQLFGFPPTFTRWIEECVSTTSFSIGLNGKPHGFFAGARGLRQGDPLSPYLFVLVMEALHLGFLQRIEQDIQFTYHWKCESSKVFQMGFADDLLLLCKADLDSIRVFKEGLDWLTISDCQPLISKIDARINGWEGISLSYAGRVQIIKSVLSALSLYWASAFILPKKVINEIEKRLRTFLWKGTTSSGYAKVAWKDVCRPMDEGGLGFKDISTLNRALMSKKLCNVIQCDRTSIWVQWLYQDRLRERSIWTIREHGGSWGWRKILRLRPFLRAIVDYQIGNGDRFFVWQDPWHHLGPLIERFPQGPRHLRLEESAKLSLVISAGEWQWPTITDFECLEITHNLPLIFGGEDRVVWRCDEGQPTTQALYRLFTHPEPKVGWSSLLLGSLKIPRHSFILWLAILGKLPTTDKSWLSHLGVCILCDEGATESHPHLFFQCRFSRQCLYEIRRRIRFHWPNRDWATDIEWATRKWRGEHIINRAYRTLLAACVYHI